MLLGKYTVEIMFLAKITLNIESMALSLWEHIILMEVYPLI